MEEFLKFGRLKRGCVKSRGPWPLRAPSLADAHALELILQYTKNRFKDKVRHVYLLQANKKSL